MENGEQKNTLVKVRLCPPCSDLLNYKTHKKKVVKRRRGVPKLVSKLNNKEGKKYADDYISVGGASKGIKIVYVTTLTAVLVGLFDLRRSIFDLPDGIAFSMDEY